MKKIFGLVVFIVCLSLLFVGCGTSSAPDFADKDFLKSLASGLEARWEITDKYLKDDFAPVYGEKGYPQEALSWVNAELSAIGEYTDATFEDSKLQEHAIAYINCIKDQKETVEKYCNIDDYKYDEKWNAAYNEKSKLIAIFVNDYGLTVSPKYKSNLDDLIRNAISVEEDEAIEDAVNAMVENVEFKLESNDFGYKTYVAVIENTTKIDFTGFSLLIQLIDKDGVIISEEYSGVSNFKQGQKARFEFSTDEKFESYRISAEW